MFVLAFFRKKKKRACIITSSPGAALPVRVVSIYYIFDYTCAGSPRALRTRQIERSRDFANFEENLSPSCKPLGHKVPMYAAPPFFSQMNSVLKTN